PKGDDAQKSARQAAIETATRHAAEVPMETLRTVARVEALVHEVMDKGNPNCITDAGVAAQLVRTAAYGAAYNVRINLSGMNDKEFVKKHHDEISDLMACIESSADQFGKKVENALA
ncbi:MAG: cyclodeaminase/cyclohydrolase family protein, partial [Deltaproteobacteria bacterium]|nr:cyclodeaminase/cyclohydrolase family protein [Deltaproteobacteria bacterium]